jgi:uncharacterized phiE125 gp8 family phage protein
VPFLRTIPTAISIDMTLGYGTDGSFVPDLLKQAIRQFVVHSYEQRGDQYSEDKNVTHGIDRMLGAASWGCEL